MRIYRSLWVICGVLIAALTIVFWPERLSSGDPFDSAAVVRRGDLVVTVSAAGSLVAQRSADITPPTVPEMWDFKIARLVPEGAQVRAGEILVEFDDQQVVRELLEHQAEMGKAQEELSKRRLEYDVQLRDLRVQVEQAKVNVQKAKHKADVDVSLTTMTDYKQAQIELEQAETEFTRLQEKMQATVEMSKAELATLGNSLANARIRVERDQKRQQALKVAAPIAGVVVYRRDWRGDKKQVGQTAWRAEAIMEIPDLATLRLEAMVEEANAGRVSVGQPVSIRLDAFPELQLTGNVTSVGRVLRTKRWDTPVKVIDAAIELDRKEGKLLPGMTASGDIEVDRIESVLLLPVKSVYERDGKTLVRIRSRSGQIEQRPVRLGRRNSQFVEVLEGVREGERLAP